MAKTTTNGKAPRMSDAAVKAKTGKDWKQWFAILDRAGASQMGHPEIVKYLNARHGIGPWWQQTVTVTYEQARGLRELYQRPAGYSISVSRTVGVPVAKLYKTFANQIARKTWLNEDGLVIRKATANKSMRISWNDGKTSVEIGFFPKADNKSQVAVQHSKLSDAKAAAKMKAYWAKALDRLRGMLEQ
jgi:uncharacterized protein YndB with AHSA1/START domain